MPPDAEPSQPRRPSGRYQYSLASLLLVTALVSVLAAALGGMLRNAYGESSVPLQYFVIMMIAAPLGVMIVVSLLWLAIRLVSRRR
jgi:hypothetical protein